MGQDYCNRSTDGSRSLFIWVRRGEGDVTRVMFTSESHEDKTSESQYGGVNKSSGIAVNVGLYYVYFFIFFDPSTNQCPFGKKSLLGAASLYIRVIDIASYWINLPKIVLGSLD